MRVQVIKRPIYTEKAVEIGESLNKYVFEVARNANKIMIRQAVEARFDVKVKNVRIVNLKGKMKRMTIRSGGHVLRTEGHQRNWKKAIVTLKPDNVIDLTSDI